MTGTTEGLVLDAVVGLALLQITLDMSQGPQQRRSGGERRCAVNPHTPVIHLGWCAFSRLIAPQILRGQNPTTGLHVRHHTSRQLAFVKIPVPGSG